MEGQIMKGGELFMDEGAMWRSMQGGQAGMHDGHAWKDRAGRREHGRKIYFNTRLLGQRNYQIKGEILTYIMLKYYYRPKLWLWQ